MFSVRYIYGFAPEIARVEIQPLGDPHTRAATVPHRAVPHLVLQVSGIGKCPDKLFAFLEIHRLVSSEVKPLRYAAVNDFP